MKVLKFYMDTCPPCKVLTKLISTWGTPKIEIENIDIKTNIAMRTKYRVNAVPILIQVDEHGNEIKRIRGLKLKEIQEMLY